MWIGRPFNIDPEYKRTRLIEIFWNSRNTKSPAPLSLSPGSHCMFLLVLVVCFYLIGLQGLWTTKLISQSFNGEKWEKFHTEIVACLAVIQSGSTARSCSRQSNGTTLCSTGSRLTNCTLCLGVNDFRNGHGWMMNSRSSVVCNIDG
ncbi:hypothetical protein L1987_85688 [Smallanthus sonchifolius]|uniref:Uncharacterized protein n=1 Tax=Smallanthus sonchifolius TaxID=185202 RepID=A0ACB8XWK1_9ASTR|nr:hypothetical protein L1987_85688 [Smallanthus sonchifolius]